jgi:phosphotransferase system HPr-like phosphotransfer protein
MPPEKFRGFERIKYALFDSARRLKNPAPRGITEIPELKSARLFHRPFTVIYDARFNLHSEKNLAYLCYIAKDCNLYDGDIFFRTIRPKIKTLSAKSPMDLMVMELSPGSLVDIYVENIPHEDYRAQALRVYSGITTPGERPDWTRFSSKH